MTAGQGAESTPLQFVQAQPFQGIGDTGNLGRCQAQRRVDAEGNVGVQVEVREQVMLLKYDRYRALRGRQGFDRGTIEQYLPGSRRQESGDQAQQGRLA
jgi:hypothetical protein